MRRDRYASAAAGCATPDTPGRANPTGRHVPSRAAGRWTIPSPR